MFESNKYHDYQKMEEPLSQKEYEEEEVDEISTPGADAEDNPKEKAKCCENYPHECPGRPSQVINLHIHMAPSDFAPGEAPHLIDENDPRFRCCCHKIHSTRGAFLIGLFELVFAGINLVESIRSFTVGAWIRSTFTTLMALIFVVVVVLMIYGVRKEKKAFLIPHLIWSIILCCIAIIAGIIVLSFWFTAAAKLSWALALNDKIGGSTYPSVTLRPPLDDEDSDVKQDLPQEPDTHPDDDFVERKPKKQKEDSRYRRLAKSSQSIEPNVKKGLKDDKTRTKFIAKDLDEAGSSSSRNDTVADSTASSEATKNGGGVASFLWALVIIIIVVLIVVTVLQIWFFITIRACYEYLKAKETNLNRAEMAVLKPLRAAIDEATENT